MRDWKKPGHLNIENKPNNKIVWLIFAFTILLLGAWLVYKNNHNSEKIDKAQNAPKNEEALPVIDLTPAINGILVEEATALQRPIAVVVENHPDARPQSGLVDADIVYETLAEGGITRFLAIYQTKEVKNIGPIRSARTYFAEIANELGAVFAHVGGNSDALENIRNRVYPNVSDADQFFNDPYFHRIKQRPMPHNVYTSIANLKELSLTHKFSQQANLATWKFKDVEKSATSSQEITINFSEKDYEVSYVFDPIKNLYKRYLAGKAHKDLDSGRQIEVKNVIVQFVKTFPTKTDTLYSIGMDLTSGGKALVFSNGQAANAVWKKTLDGRTRYYDLNNLAIIFNPGQIWVALVPEEREPLVIWK